MKSSSPGPTGDGDWPRQPWASLGDPLTSLPLHQTNKRENNASQGWEQGQCGSSSVLGPDGW